MYTSYVLDDLSYAVGYSECQEEEAAKQVAFRRCRKRTFVVDSDEEGWPSGLRRTLGKRVCGQPYRGFKSRPFRHEN